MGLVSDEFSRIEIKESGNQSLEPSIKVFAN
jgi:hypothetical protein